MLQFFHGWRRKLGVLTLVLACVFAAWWVRSQTLIDCTDFMLGDCPSKISSMSGAIQWSSYHATEHLAVDYPIWQTFPNVLDNPNDSAFLGFNANHDTESVRYAFRTFWQAPYWSIVLPLTLLSASLLFSKPRKTTAVPTSKTSGE